MNVYLNGVLDNGILSGRVSDMRRSSREAVYIGRRSDLKGYEFAGAIADVRIYSRALTQAEVAADMRGKPVDDRGTRSATETNLAGDRTGSRKRSPAECAWSSEFEDRKLPVAVAVLGILVAVASVGCWPSAGPLLWLVVSPFAGLLLLHVASPTLPTRDLWTFPLVSLAGAGSVVASVRRAGLRAS